MALFAIIEDGGKQYRVQEGMTLEVEKKALDVGAQLDFDRVLLTSDGQTVHVGTPVVGGARVVAQVTDQVRGPKQEIFTYKRRKTYRRRKGHRQAYTRVRIRDIVLPETA